LQIVVGAAGGEDDEVIVAFAVCFLEVPVDADHRRGFLPRILRMGTDEEGASQFGRSRKFLASVPGSTRIVGFPRMRILDRYITRQIITTGLFAVGVLSLVLVLGNVFKELLDLLVNHDVPIQFILTFIAFIIPFSLTFTIPWGFLTAVLLIFGRLSAENELIALRSNGVSVPRLCMPVFGLSIICVGICLWINVDVAPKAQRQMKIALYQIATSNPIALFGSDSIIDQFPGDLIYVEKKNGTNLDNILVYQLNDRGQPIMEVHAKKGELKADLSGDPQIILTLRDAQYVQHDSAKPDNPSLNQTATTGVNDIAISLKELYERNVKKSGPSQLTLTELLKKELDSSLDREQMTAIRTETNKRFSFSLASFAFCLIAVPLAITAHRKETSIGFLFSLVVAFVYFFFIVMVDMVRTKPQFHPELLIWLPNVVFIGLGAVLFYRMSRR
jgi:LPS export ABC transporter permease LptF